MPRIHRTHCNYGHPLVAENLYIRKDGRRICKTCAKNRPPAPAEKIAEYKERWEKKHPGRNLLLVRKGNLKKLGITLEGYDELLKKQGGVCAICKKECNTGRRLAVDHNHVTGKIRGLLCTNCNTGLGQFKDNPELLRVARDYILTPE